jgi:general stress protein 26
MEASPMSDSNPQQHLYDLLKDFSTAMLVSHDAGGRMHARPMAIADLRPDADAYFATSITTPKVQEVQNAPDVLVTFQSATQFASVIGTATIVKDRQLIERLWSEEWRVWFPEGKDAPDLVLIRVEAREGEFWDNSGLHGLKYVFEGVKAVIKGEKLANDKGGAHAKIRLVSS